MPAGMLTHSLTRAKKHLKMNRLFFFPKRDTRILLHFQHFLPQNLSRVVFGNPRQIELSALNPRRWSSLGCPGRATSCLGIVPATPRGTRPAAGIASHDLGGPMRSYSRAS